MTIIPLTQGYQALIDDEDLALASRFKWRVAKVKSKNKTLLYAVTGQWRNGSHMYIHRLIMRPGHGYEIDHKNGDGLNCRRSNMRICTHKQNCSNLTTPPKNRFFGVDFIKQASHKNPWRARIKSNGTFLHLGLFETPEIAAAAYNKAAKQLFGEFAKQNLISPCH